MLNPVLYSVKYFILGFNYDWCVTCKIYKIVDLDNSRALYLFQRETLLQFQLNLLTNMIKCIPS